MTNKELLDSLEEIQEQNAIVAYGLKDCIKEVKKLIRKEK